MRIVNEADVSAVEDKDTGMIEDIPFQRWLEDLEKVRLPQAWERFRKGEKFLKDVGA